jgi:hypothetical protein
MSRTEELMDCMIGMTTDTSVEQLELERKIAGILNALGKVKISRVLDEVEIHEKIAEQLKQANIVFKHEYKLISHKRFDFWISGIVIEVKKQRPETSRLIKQLERYTSAPEVKAIIVVIEKAYKLKGILPKKLNDKPVYTISLSKNWGVAL